MKNLIKTLIKTSAQKPATLSTLSKTDMEHIGGGITNYTRPNTAAALNQAAANAIKNASGSRRGLA